MTNSIFNPNKTYFNLITLLGYIDTPDLYIRKFLSENIKNYSESTDTVACHLTFQSGHLSNKKLKNDYLKIFNLILGCLTIDPDKIKEIKNKFIVQLDNATKNLSVVLEFNSLTTTITMVSVPVTPDKQTSVHTRNKIYDTFYIPGTLSIFNDDKKDPYTLVGRRDLFEKISLAKLNTESDEFRVASFYIDVPSISNDPDVRNLMKSEMLNTLNGYTGFNIRDTEVQDFNSNYVNLFKDKKGFYLNLREYR